MDMVMLGVVVLGELYSCSRKQFGSLYVKWNQWLIYYPATSFFLTYYKNENLHSFIQKLV